MMEIQNKRFGKLECFTSGFLFKIVYFILVLVSFNTLALDIPYLKTGLVGVSVVLGGIVLLYRLIHFKRFLKMKYIGLLLAFLISYLISMLLNLRYGFMEPLQAMVWMTFQYLILFLKDPERPREKEQKEFRVITWMFCLYTFFSSLLSLLMLVFNYSAFDYERTPIKRAGLIWGRLWGVYTDPNLGAVFSAAAILLGIYLAAHYKTVVAKIFCGLHIVFQMLYIAFSDSRTGLLSLIAGGAVYAYLRLSGVPALKKKKVLQQTVCFAVALCTVCVLFILPKGIKASYNKIVTSISSSTGDIVDDPSEEPVQPEIPSTIGREEDLTNDVSNHRFDLWKSGLEIYRLNPIFGVSIFNMVPFAQKYLPNTYILNNGMGIFDNVHNAFLNILIGQGIVGFIIVMIFTVLSVALVFKGFWKEKNILSGRDSKKTALLISALAAFAASMLVQGDIFYLNSGASFMFWNTLGFLILHFTGKDGETSA